MAALAGMRVFITGAAGFVGLHLQPRLEAAGAVPIATDRELDVSDAGAVAAAVERERPDAIVHLAAQSSVVASWEDPRGAYEVSYLGAHAVLEAARRSAPEARILLVGSGEVYGSAAPGAPPFDEAAPLRPQTPYGRAKAAADLLGAAYARRGLDVVRVRPFNHTGPGQSDGFVASSFARQIAEIETGARAPVLRVGNLESVRDFLDVGDVVDAYVRLLDRSVPATVYNVASGTGVPVRAILERLLARARVEPEVEVDPERVRPADASVGSAARLGAATSWSPRVPLADTLAGLLDDWRRRVSAG